MLMLLVFVVIFGTKAEDKGFLKSGDHIRSRRHIYVIDTDRPCPDGSTCCSEPYYDSELGNKTFYLKCGEIPEAFPPCRRIHRKTRGFPACCPLLVCPPFFTYMDAYVFTISLLKSFGKATFEYGRKGQLTRMPESDP